MNTTLQSRAAADASEDHAATIAVAIFSADPGVCTRLREMLSGDVEIAFAGATDDPAARLLDQAQVIVADTSSHAALVEEGARPARCVVLCAQTDCVALLEAGAAAVLPPTAGPEEILAAVKAVARGLAVLPRALMPMLLAGDALAELSVVPDAAPLTPRELEVLAAMADGASNKAIARRLGISFHTAKFHVAAILAKLDADTRTEAVTKAAQRGLVML
jgi:DNA-binding NarL/FixJ family response regulator